MEKLPQIDNAPATKYWRLCLWGGPVFAAALTVFWALVANIIPPLSAALPAEQIAQSMRDNANLLRAGMVGSIAFLPFYLLWGIGISKVMEAVEGKNRVLSRLQLWGAGLNTGVFLFGFCILLFGVYRPEAYSNELLQFTYDAFWIAELVTIPPAMMSQVAIGFCFLGSARGRALIPSWVSWLSLWVAISGLLEVFLPFVKSCPFSRSGMINFWFEFSVFFVWMVSITVYSMKAVTRLERESAFT